MSTPTNFVINAITSAVDSMVNASLTFDASCVVVRDYRTAGTLDGKTARTYFQAALVSKVPSYVKQVTDKGFPAQGSAFQRAVSRLMKATAPISANRMAVAELDVPANVLAAAKALWALCAAYEAAGKLAATAIATVKAGK